MFGEETEIFGCSHVDCAKGAQSHTFIFHLHRVVLCHKLNIALRWTLNYFSQIKIQLQQTKRTRFLLNSDLTPHLLKTSHMNWRSGCASFVYSIVTLLYRQQCTTKSCEEEEEKRFLLRGSISAQQEPNRNRHRHTVWSWPFPFPTGHTFLRWRGHRANHWRGH